MSSDFDKDTLDVERHYSRNWFTTYSANFLHKHSFKTAYALARWLVGYANVLRSASPRDGYEWVDRRSSLFAKHDAESQAQLVADSLKSLTNKGSE